MCRSSSTCLWHDRLHVNPNLTAGTHTEKTANISDEIRWSHYNMTIDFNVDNLWKFNWNVRQNLGRQAEDDVSWNSTSIHWIAENYVRDIGVDGTSRTWLSIWFACHQETRTSTRPPIRFFKFHRNGSKSRNKCNIYDYMRSNWLRHRTVEMTNLKIYVSLWFETLSLQNYWVTHNEVHLRRK